MIDKSTENIIQEIKNTLKSKYDDFFGLYLFGSRARGDNNQFSDLDLAIIFKRKIDTNLKTEISHLMAEFMIKYDIIIDNPVFAYNDIINPRIPLAENIQKQGVFYG